MEHFLIRTRHNANFRGNTLLQSHEQYKKTTTEQQTTTTNNTHTHTHTHTHTPPKQNKKQTKKTHR